MVPSAGCDNPPPIVLGLHSSFVKQPYLHRSAGASQSFPGRGEDALHVTIQESDQSYNCTSHGRRCRQYCCHEDTRYRAHVLPPPHPYHGPLARFPSHERILPTCGHRVQSPESIATKEVPFRSSHIDLTATVARTGPCSAVGHFAEHTDLAVKVQKSTLTENRHIAAAASFASTYREVLSLAWLASSVCWTGLYRWTAVGRPEHHQAYFAAPIHMKLPGYR